MSAIVTEQAIRQNAEVFTNEMNELVERLALYIDGKDVQILRFDGNNNRILVKVDTSMNVMPLGSVDRYIRGRL